MTWYAFQNGATVGQSGSESGIVIRDDEFSGGARITAERGGQASPFSITCGVYGWMVHTRFFGAEVEMMSEYERMREALASIVEIIPIDSDPNVEARSREVGKAIAGFVERFP